VILELADAQPAALHNGSADRTVIEASLHERTYKNFLLRTLDADIILRLRLQPVTFELEHQIEFLGELIRKPLFR